MHPLPWHQKEFDRLLAGKGGLAHALLVHGPRGIGKVDFARALAVSLLCESPASDGRACGACVACGWFESAAHPDYRQIEPASAAREGEDGEGSEKKATTISVDQVRALADFVNVSSHRGGAKVIVIQPTEALNASAANALLKSLEEPPPRTHFILVAHRPHLVLPTIRSRCVQLALKAPERASAAAWLTSHGLRDAPLALAHTGDAPLLALELEASGYWGARAAFLRQITGRELDVLGAAEAVRDFPIPHVVSWLQKWSYDIVYYRALRIVRYNPDHADAIARIAPAVEPLAALRFYREMAGHQRVAQHPLNARLFIEQLLFAYLDLVRPLRIAA